MYFNDNKNSTNIDYEFSDNKDSVLSRIVNFISRYKKIFIIGIVVIVLLVVMLLLFINKNINNYLILSGDEVITIYQGDSYVEPGYKAYNSYDEDLSGDVKLESNLNTGVIGEYEILYKLGDITKVRYVKVIEKLKDYVFMSLTPVNNNIDIYLKKGDKYIEPGYRAFSTSGIDLTDKVTITGKVDTSKKGTYTLTYSVIDTNGVTISKVRKVIVMDSEISLTLNNDNYTNQEIIINAYVIDEYFDYMILPDNNKVTMNNYSYKVNSNGTYTFKVYDKKGNSKESSIKVNNIDKEAPSGSCTIDQDDNGSVITINAKDSTGIAKYVYNNKDYSSNTITLTNTINDAKVKIYDKAGNNIDIKCTIAPKLYINSISNDGVIVTINVKKINKEISGYYFSYTNQRPDKNTGGYLSTDRDSIDVVRLPGTTYVWVEDKSGNISAPKQITLSNDVLFNDSKVLKGTALADYLSNNGSSLEELNKLMARSVRAAGLYTSEASATSAVTLIAVLADKYGIRLPYESAGLYRKFGANKKWGNYGYNYTTKTSGYYGMDCSAFISWTYVNAGYILENQNPGYWGGFPTLDFAPENGEIGDILVVGRKKGDRHVKLIIGKTDTGFITAEASASNSGTVIKIHQYSSPDGYSIEKSSNITGKYQRYSIGDYPTGF